MTALEQQLLDAEAERQAKSEAERRAAEDARRRREAEEAERARAAEERARARAAQGLSPEEIRKAEELASCDYVRARGDEADVRDHLARFPGGVTERNAMAKLDGLVWSGLGKDPALTSLQQYVGAFPKGDHLDEARARIAQLEKAEADGKALADRKAAETAAWGAVAASKVPEEIEAFLKQWPDGEYADAARARLRELAFGALGKRIAKVTPALTMAVVALALWLLLAFAGFILGASRTRAEITLLLLTPLSAAIVATALYLYTPLSRSQIGVAVAASTIASAIWSSVSIIQFLYTGLTASTLAGAAIAEPRTRNWKIVLPSIGAAFAISFSSPASFGFDLYFVGLPVALIWAVALGSMLARTNKPPADGEILKASQIARAPDTTTVANPANGNADRRATAVR